MNRTPPADVQRELRSEVGFACPVADCGNPYLTWHHFDPPWAEKQHQDPAGMVALCRVHADQADAGAFTPEQIRELKAAGRERAEAQSGRFNWMRNRLLAVIGGTLYYDCRVPLQIHGRQQIWFDRDKSGRFLLNINMPATTPTARRMIIFQNCWVQFGEPQDLQCPPNGRLVYAKYPNGDLLRVEFFEIESAEALLKRHHYAESAIATLEEQVPGVFPITAVEVRMKVMAPDGSTALDFDSQKTRIGGGSFVGSLILGGDVGFSIG